MCAAAFDFVAERGFIAASDDPSQLFDWMSDYDQRRRDARAEGDDHEAAQFEELRQEAEDRVVELKAAWLRRVAPRSAAPEPMVRPAAGAPTRPEIERPSAHASVHGAAATTIDPLAVARAERARRRQAEETAARRAAVAGSVGGAKPPSQSRRGGSSCIPGASATTAAVGEDRSQQSQNKRCAHAFRDGVRRLP